MKLLVLSDLHPGIAPFHPRATEADAVVLAEATGPGTKVVELAADEADTGNVRFSRGPRSP
ncbi:MAG TPA: hypothetical protein VNP72_04100 [Longimicrobium sp.]|nr:hypothetical protein [Longimicrobium sp.]